MKLIAQVKLTPTEEQHQALLKTLETVNDAANYISKRAWETKTFRQYDLHHLLYYDLRSRFKLTAQIVVRVLAKVADAYKLDRRTKREFRPLGGIAYDRRILSWRLSDQTINIWTMKGRQRMSFVAGSRSLALLQHLAGEADLMLVNGEFYLFQTCEVDEPPAGEVEAFLGVDLGVKNIAADSDGKVYSSAHLNGLRHRQRGLRARLQARGTRAARRLLVRRKRKGVALRPMGQPQCF